MHDKIRNNKLKDDHMRVKVGVKFIEYNVAENVKGSMTQWLDENVVSSKSCVQVIYFVIYRMSFSKKYY